MRGADALAQALDLLANHRGISHDRRLGDHARVMQVEDARAAARAPVLGAVARVLARRAPSQQADLRASCARDATRRLDDEGNKAPGSFLFLVHVQVKSSQVHVQYST